VVGWINTDNRQGPTNSDTFATQTDIDYFIKNANFKSFTITGQLSNTAHSPSIKHFEHSQHSIAQTLTIESYSPTGIEASISADKANISDSDNAITFQHNVIVTGYREQQSYNFLKTQVLTYNRHNQSIATHDHVEITDALGNIITATGLLSDLHLRTLNLKQNVKGNINAN